MTVLLHMRGRAGYKKRALYGWTRIGIYPGQYYDSETGLHYNWFRYYDPNTGRYLRVDPIGFWGGINFYTYSLNNPLNYFDPYGLYYYFIIMGIIDFSEGFFVPGPPPPTPLAYIGSITRNFVDEEVGYMFDLIIEYAPRVWENYYKYHINPNWMNDPNDPYYIPLQKEFFWEVNPGATCY